MVFVLNMAINAYKAKGNTENQIPTLLLSGLTSTIKSWQDMYIAPDENTMILNAKKTIIKQEKKSTSNYSRR